MNESSFIEFPDGRRQPVPTGDDPCSQWIRDTLATAPPLADWQRERLRVLLDPGPDPNTQ
ncbi:MAG: hypothetical protein FWE15_20980 [Actinomycetia bacterium]|nr:hypothetical protein [Actinomycetes bacterium]